MNPSIQLDDTRVHAWLQRLVLSGRSPRRAMVSIARYGKTSTQMRFRTQTDPDGRRWWPSARAKAQGGQTLRNTNRLFRSITSAAGNDYAEWGTNVAYAAAHNFGVRKMVNIAAHRRRISGTSRTGRSWAKVVPVKSFVRLMFLPRRQYIGFSATDRAMIIDILREFVESASKA
ncbi:phage virion morphogenesis protein [Stenotrophomonas maltophilia]|uniref:phage virion morphogenesis protein n=1 Tax=Stenotrophomonas maltophilia TaxID=40324 RepID=UPI0006AC7A95|nr:phage virion morphogenesis protein [Stenotrophomonas maltophilia]MBN4937094.1 phage virion morphogenesis protein [Stenotrophomonas maltophilia]